MRATEPVGDISRRHLAPRHFLAFGITEADDTIAARLGPARAYLAVIRMLSAVDLDDESRLGAKEIDDIWPERMLAAEAGTFELFRRRRDHNLISASVGV